MHWTGAITSAVQASEEVLVSLHSTVGLPWFWAIPAFALGINVVMRFPLQYYSRKTILQQQSHSHFTQAWMVRHANKLDEKTATLLHAKTIRRLNKERGCQQWKTYIPILSVAPWLIVAQAMRNLTGTGGGLVSAMAPSTAQAAQAASTTGLAETTAWIDEITTTAQPVVESIQQSLTTGGMLWFHDLTVADPYAVLPVMLSLSFLHNVLPKGTDKLRALFMATEPGHRMTRAARMRSRLNRGLVVVAVVVPFITMNLPAGMLLYWVWSSTLASVNSTILDRILPVRPSEVKVCRGRPVKLLTQ